MKLSAILYHVDLKYCGCAFSVLFLYAQSA